MPPRLRRRASRERGTLQAPHDRAVLDGQMRRDRVLEHRARTEGGHGRSSDGHDVFSKDRAAVGRWSGKGGDDLLGESPDRGVVERDVENLSRTTQSVYPATR